VVSGARLHRYTYREYLSLEHAANVRIPSLREVVLVAYDERLVGCGGAKRRTSGCGARRAAARCS
jgi:hypothetical protein